MDPATIERLVAEHPEGYRGGKIDGTRLTHIITRENAWERARRCLDDDNPARAAYWAGFAGGEG